MNNFTLALSTLVGTIVGAGIFGIPFAMLKSGIVPGLFYLFLLGAIICLLHLFFGEVCLRTSGKHRLVGYANIYLGKWGKTVATLTLLFVLVSGCTTTFDHGAKFTIDGLVQDSDSGIEVANAKVQIIDHSMDYARSKSGNYCIAEGRSGNDGTFSILFSYWWGTKGFLAVDGPSGIIKVVVEAQGYKQREFLLKCSAEHYWGGAFQFDLGAIDIEAVRNDGDSAPLFETPVQ